MHVANLGEADAVEWERLLRDGQLTVEDQFAAIVERQSRFVFRVAYAVLRNVQDSEDVVQEMFLKLYRTGAWQHMREERAFLARAVWRMAIEKVPANRDCTVATEMISHTESPETELMNASRTRAVHQLIDSLPEELRRPLALSAVEELNSREIAQIMAIPEGTVRRRIMRARQLLREKLKQMEIPHER